MVLWDLKQNPQPHDKPTPLQRIDMHPPVSPHGAFRKTQAKQRTRGPVPPIAEPYTVQKSEPAAMDLQREP